MAPRTTPAKGKGKARAPEVKDEAAIPLGKQLAHTDKAVRDQAIRNLSAFLSAGGESDDTDDPMSESTYTRLSELEMAKLWKGLFYCFWMSDKPLIQQALASELADLLLRINPRVPGDKETRAAARLDAALSFLQGFWVCLVREWSGIDRLRIDKFYLLIRRFVNASFRLMARHGWSEGVVGGVNEILCAERGPMSWQDKSVPSSLGTHLADVYMPELDKVVASGEGAEVPLVEVLRPFILLAARTRTSTVRERFLDTVIKPVLGVLLPEGERPAKTPEWENVASLGGRKELLKALFETAAQEETVESNRRKIYQLVREEDDE